METLIVAEQTYFQLGNYQLKVIAYLGCFTPNIYSFKVSFQARKNPDLNESESEINRAETIENFPEKNDSLEQFGLLRVGSLDSGLLRELTLRESLNNYGLIAPLIAKEQRESVTVNHNTKAGVISSDSAGLSSQENLDQTTSSENLLSSVEQTTENNSNPEDNLDSGVKSIIDQENDSLRDSSPKNEDFEHQKNDQNYPISNDTQDSLDSDSDTLKEEESEDNYNYLPDEIYEDEPIEPSEQILLLTDFPNLGASLEQLLQNYSHQEQSLNAQSLNLVIQLCQCCSYLAERNWNMINLVPLLIEFQDRLKLYDLTQIFPTGEQPTFGLSGGYCAPELATGSAINSLMSSYTVGALLYQIIHQKVPNSEYNLDLQPQPIPRFFQILKKVLSPLPERRLKLTGLRQGLLDARRDFFQDKMIWQTASKSTVGLSLDRLENEDNFGIRYEQINDKETLIIGMVADGMGGMAKGEIASKVAIETFLKEPIPLDFNYSETRNNWLMDTCAKAHQAISKEAENGGTTLSIILAVNEQLMIAHVGDSRIYLLRQGEIKQLSQDHSLVGVLVNNGEITEEEAENHPDRNVLLKCLGSKESLREGHIQNLMVTTQQLVLSLEDQDILLLCSDGVWDLVSKKELQDIFSNSKFSLQEAVNLTLEQVLEKGASDNATLLALQCIIKEGKL